MTETIGIGELAVVTGPGKVIKTYALGSCVAVIGWDWHHGVAGMVHVAHPDSSINQKKASETPGYFADTGVRELLKKMEQQGAKQSKIVIKLVGGAAVMEQILRFDIGKENVLAVKKALWQIRMGVLKSDVGGNLHRTVWIETDNGEVRIRHNDREWML